MEKFTESQIERIVDFAYGTIDLYDGMRKQREVKPRIYMFTDNGELRVSTQTRLDYKDYYFKLQTVDSVVYIPVLYHTEGDFR